MLLSLITRIFSSIAGLSVARWVFVIIVFIAAYWLFGNEVARQIWDILIPALQGEPM